MTTNAYSQYLLGRDYDHILTIGQVLSVVKWAVGTRNLEAYEGVSNGYMSPKESFLRPP